MAFVLDRGDEVLLDPNTDMRQGFGEFTFAKVESWQHEKEDNTVYFLVKFLVDDSGRDREAVAWVSENKIRPVIYRAPALCYDTLFTSRGAKPQKLFVLGTKRRDWDTRTIRQVGPNTILLAALYYPQGPPRIFELPASTLISTYADESIWYTNEDGTIVVGSPETELAKSGKTSGPAEKAIAKFRKRG